MSKRAAPIIISVFCTLSIFIVFNVVNQDSYNTNQIDISTSIQKTTSTFNDNANSRDIAQENISYLDKKEELDVENNVNDTLVLENMTLLLSNESQTLSENENLLPKSSFSLPKDTKILLVHVGKTAGRTLMCELGFGAYDGSFFCQNYTPATSALAQASIGRTHMGFCNLYKFHTSSHMQFFRKNPIGSTEQFILGRTHFGLWDFHSIGNFNALLFTLRNPLERISSYFFYEHPAKRSYARYHKCANAFHKWEHSPEGCFETFQEFAEHLDDTHSKTSNYSQCHELAWNVILGKVRCKVHNYFNYAFYYKYTQYQLHQSTMEQLKQNFVILGIRTEYLADDWDQLDRALNTSSSLQPTRFSKPPEAQVLKQATKTKSEKQASRELSRKAKDNLCNALCFEIQVYKALLYLAQNLDSNKMRDSIKDLIYHCPHETFELRKCSLHSVYFSPFDGKMVTPSITANTIEF